MAPKGCIVSIQTCPNHTSKSSDVIPHQSDTTSTLTETNIFLGGGYENHRATELWERTTTENKVFLIMSNCQKSEIPQHYVPVLNSPRIALSFLTNINGLHLWSNQWQFSRRAPIPLLHLNNTTHNSLSQIPLIKLRKHPTRWCFLLRPWLMISAWVYDGCRKTNPSTSSKAQRLE